MSIVAQGFGIEGPSGSGTSVSVNQEDVFILTQPVEVALLDTIEVVLLSAT